MTSKAHFGFGKPLKVKGDRNKRDPKKHCRFHNDIGHTTNECWNLRNAIEKLIQDGHLNEFKRREGDEDM